MKETMVMTDRLFTFLEVLLAVLLAVGAGLCAGAAGSVVLGVGVGLVSFALVSFVLVFVAQLPAPSKGGG